MKTKSILLVAGAAVLVAGLALPVLRPRPRTLSRYETVSTTRGDLSQHTTASGTLSAVGAVEVGSQVSGKISALHADFNSTVTKGQLIAEIDPTIYAAQLRQAEGELASAEATLQLRKQNLERKRVLTPLRAASQLDLDQATAELSQAEAALDIRKASVESARASLGYCRIVAPVEGVVIARKVDVGQTVIAAMTTPVLFTLAEDTTQMKLSAAVSEADIGLVADGQPVEFTVDAFPDETFSGRVTQVRRSPVTTQNVVTYETIIAVANPERKLFPGMTADVSILVRERRGVLKVPNAALRYSPPEGARFEGAPPRAPTRGERLVYVLGSDPTLLRAVLVRAGISDALETEIVEGLDPASRVVTATLEVKSGPGLIPPPPPQAGG